MQTSTENPYGHRPWATRLYTTFDNFSYLKQPQNRILRENLAMRPEIYKPPELNLSGLGSPPMIVFGSGRVMRPRRRQLGAVSMIVRGPMVDGGLPMPGPMPVKYPIYLGPPTPAPPVMPFPSPPVQGCPPNVACIKIPYPPTIVPPVPVPVSSSPDGVVYALPGTPATPGSPYMPATPGELPVPGTPVTPGSTVSTGGSFMDWFNSSTWIAGVPNGFVALGAAGVLFIISRKRGR